MTNVQWAPGHDNEAGYVDIITNKAGQSTAMVSPVRYAAYTYAGDLSAKGKGAKFCTVEIVSLAFDAYTTIRETNLGFTSAESDISKAITISLPEPDQVTFNNWNATVYHRPGVDTELDATGQWYERAVFTVVIEGAT